MSRSQPPTTLNSRPAPPAEPGADYWVHWRYSEAEWGAWIAAEQKRMHEDLIGQRVALGLVGAFLLVIISAMILPDSRAAATSATLLCLVGAWFVAAIIAIVLGANTIYNYRKAPQVYAQRRQAPRDVAINPWWVWQEGKFTPLLRSAQSRLRVRLLPDPLRLHFRVEDMDWATRAVTAREAVVLVPQGQKAAAQQLVARFEREIIGVPPQPQPPRTAPAPPVGPPPGPASQPVPTTQLPPLPPAVEAETQALGDGRSGRPAAG